MVAMVIAGSIVVRVVSSIVPVCAGPRNVVHDGLVIVVAALFVVAPFDDALALDNSHRPFDVRIALIVTTKVRSRSRLRNRPNDADGGDSAQ
jgi:hypothetical protein